MSGNPPLGSGLALDAYFVALRASTLSEDPAVADWASIEPLGNFGTAAPS